MERRQFTREFKLEAVKLIQERGVTVAQASRDLGVHGTVLRRWVQECAADSSVQLYCPSSGLYLTRRRSDRACRYAGVATTAARRCSVHDLEPFHTCNAGKCCLGLLSQHPDRDDGAGKQSHDLQRRHRRLRPASRGHVVCHRTCVDHRLSGLCPPRLLGEGPNHRAAG